MCIGSVAAVGIIVVGLALTGFFGQSTQTPVEAAKPIPLVPPLGPR
jgi:hypothetical protein